VCRKIILSPSIFLLTLIFLAACDKISLPRFGFESEQEARLPLNVTYAFPENLLQYTYSIDACGMPYSIPVGDLVAKSFMKVGMNRFHTIQAEPPIGQADGVPPDGYRIVLTLNHFAFDPVTRTGQEDRYQAFVDMQMQAVYENPQGAALAQSPLVYHEKVSLWIPALSGQSTSCSTRQLDATVEKAAEALAKDMISVLPRLNTSIQTGDSSQATSAPTATQPAEPLTPPQPARPEAGPSVQFRTKLVDANRNLTLESGEALVLLIETTNVTQSPIPSAYVEIRGTPVLVEAFKRVAPLPVPLGSFQPGEKRTTEIRGRLGEVSEHHQGELIIGITLSEGIPPGTHTIRAEIQPRPIPKNSSR
jgi:hypothetical protein